MSGLADRVAAVAGGLLIGAGLAPQLGDFVTYAVGLAAAGAILGRFLADWSLREYRRPSYLRRLGRAERDELDDTRGWVLWLATIAGAVAGILIALAALVFDAIAR